MKISGSVALVTGANRGLGRAYARELVSRGAAKVYGAARIRAPSPDPASRRLRWTLPTRRASPRSRSSVPTSACRSATRG